MVKKKQPREDMREDGDIDDEEQISYLMARQIVISFNQNYDKVARKNIEDLRKKKHDKKSQSFVKEYDELKAFVDRLKKKHKL